MRIHDYYAVNILLEHTLKASLEKFHDGTENNVDLQTHIHHDVLVLLDQILVWDEEP